MSTHQQSFTLKFLASVSYADSHFWQDIDELLLEADYAADNPPSALWLPPFAKLIAASHARIPEWELLTDRIQYFSNRLPGHLVAARCERDCLLAIWELAVGLLDGFPLGVPSRTSADLSLRISRTKEQNDLLFIALDLERRLAACANVGSEIRDVLNRWVGCQVSSKWSASFVASVLEYVLVSAVRSQLYDDVDFQMCANDVTIRSMHCENGKGELERLFSPAEMDEIRQLLC